MELTTTLIIGEAIAAIVLAVLFVRSRIPAQTIDQQAKLIDTLRLRVESLEQAHGVNQKAIGTLEGQIKVYKELPLQEIAKSLQILETLPGDIQRMQQESNHELIEFLKGKKVTPVMA